jgi:hypothetical protein
MEKIVFEGSQLDMRLIEIYLKEHGIRCRTIEVVPGYRVFNTSKIIVDEHQFEKADKLVRDYLKASNKTFKPDKMAIAQFIILGAMFAFLALQAIFKF